MKIKKWWLITLIGCLMAGVFAFGSQPVEASDRWVFDGGPFAMSPSGGSDDPSLLPGLLKDPRIRGGVYSYGPNAGDSATGVLSPDTGILAGELGSDLAEAGTHGAMDELERMNDWWYFGYHNGIIVGYRTANGVMHSGYRYMARLIGGIILGIASVIMYVVSLIAGLVFKVLDLLNIYKYMARWNRDIKYGGLTSRTMGTERFQNATDYDAINSMLTLVGSIRSFGFVFAIIMLIIGSALVILGIRSQKDGMTRGSHAMNVFKRFMLSLTTIAGAAIVLSSIISGYAGLMSGSLQISFNDNRSEIGGLILNYQGWMIGPYPKPTPEQIDVEPWSDMQEKPKEDRMEQAEDKRKSEVTWWRMPEVAHIKRYNPTLVVTPKTIRMMNAATHSVSRDPQDQIYDVDFGKDASAVDLKQMHWKVNELVSSPEFQLILGWMNAQQTNSKDMEATFGKESILAGYYTFLPTENGLEQSVSDLADESTQHFDYVMPGRIAAPFLWASVVSGVVFVALFTIRVIEMMFQAMLDMIRQAFRYYLPALGFGSGGAILMLFGSVVVMLVQLTIGFVMIQLFQEIMEMPLQIAEAAGLVTNIDLTTVGDVATGLFSLQAIRPFFSTQGTPVMAFKAPATEGMATLMGSGVLNGIKSWLSGLFGSGPVDGGGGGLAATYGQKSNLIVVSIFTILIAYFAYKSLLKINSRIGSSLGEAMARAAASLSGTNITSAISREGMIAAGRSTGGYYGGSSLPFGSGGFSPTGGGGGGGIAGTASTISNLARGVGGVGMMAAGAGGAAFASDASASVREVETNTVNESIRTEAGATGASQVATHGQDGQGLQGAPGADGAGAVQPGHVDQSTSDHSLREDLATSQDQAQTEAGDIPSMVGQSPTVMNQQAIQEQAARDAAEGTPPAEGVHAMEDITQSEIDSRLEREAGHISSMQSHQEASGVAYQSMVDRQSGGENFIATSGNNPESATVASLASDQYRAENGSFGMRDSTLMNTMNMSADSAVGSSNAGVYDSLTRVEQTGASVADANTWVEESNSALYEAQQAHAQNPTAANADAVTLAQADQASAQNALGAASAQYRSSLENASEQGVGMSAVMNSEGNFSGETAGLAEMKESANQSIKSGDAINTAELTSVGESAVQGLSADQQTMAFSAQEGVQGQGQAGQAGPAGIAQAEGAESAVAQEQSEQSGITQVQGEESGITQVQSGDSGLTQVQSGQSGIAQAQSEQSAVTQARHSEQSAVAQQEAPGGGTTSGTFTMDGQTQSTVSAESDQKLSVTQDGQEGMGAARTSGQALSRGAEEAASQTMAQEATRVQEGAGESVLSASMDSQAGDVYASNQNDGGRTGNLAVHGDQAAQQGESATQDHRQMDAQARDVQDQTRSIQEGHGQDQLSAGQGQLGRDIGYGYDHEQGQELSAEDSALDRGTGYDYGHDQGQTPAEQNLTRAERGEEDLRSQMDDFGSGHRDGNVGATASALGQLGIDSEAFGGIPGGIGEDILDVAQNLDVGVPGAPVEGDLDLDTQRELEQARIDAQADERYGGGVYGTMAENVRQRADEKAQDMGERARRR